MRGVGECKEKKVVFFLVKEPINMKMTLLEVVNTILTDDLMTAMTMRTTKTFHRCKNSARSQQMRNDNVRINDSPTE